MSQGDHVRINSKRESEDRLPFLLKRIEAWDYSAPLVVKLEPYKDPRSLSQNALFHVWCADLSKAFIKKVPTANKENQVKSSSKLTKGEMVHFMDNVYHWARDNGVLLKVPHDSEYARLQNQQES